MEQKQKLKIVTQWTAVLLHIQNMVHMEVVQHHAVVEQKQEKYTLIVITMDNNVAVEMKVHHVILKDVVIQHTDLEDTGQVVLHHAIRDTQITTVIDIVTTTDNIVENNIQTGITVILIHVVDQHMDLEDTGQVVQQTVVEDIKTTTVIDIVTTMDNTVEQNIGIGQVVTLIHATHATFNTIVM